MTSNYNQRAKMWFSLAVAAACATLLATVHAQPHQVMKPEDQNMSLKGTIRLIHDFGPPGYGEDPKHDAHVSYWVLEVVPAVNVPCHPGKSEHIKYVCESASRLNIFFDGMALYRLNDLPAAKWKNRRVIAQGKLHRADTEGEMTPIYITVSQIQSLNAAKKVSH